MDKNIVSVKPTASQFNKHRAIWTKVAKKEGWYKKPLFVHLFMKGKRVVDSIYQVPDLKKDTWSTTCEDDSR